jgi:hypothetical protein
MRTSTSSSAICRGAIRIDKPEQTVLRGEKGAAFVLIAMGDAEPGDHPVRVTVRSKEFVVA